MSRRQILTVLVAITVATTTMVVRSQTTAKDLTELRKQLADADRELAIARKRFQQSQAGYQRALKSAEPKLPAATVEAEAAYLREVSKRIDIESAIYGVPTSTIDVTARAREVMSTGAPIDATLRGLKVGDPAFGSNKWLTLRLNSPRGGIELHVSDGTLVQIGEGN